MNKEMRWLVIAAAILFVSAVACISEGGGVSESGGDKQTTNLPTLPQGGQWATFEGDDRLFVVVGTVAVGKYHLVPIAQATQETVTSALKIYSLSAGELVLNGYLIPVALTGGSITQQLLEGGVEYVYKGELISINRVTGEVKAIQLVRANAEQAEGARTDVREDTQNPQQKRVAFVEDDKDFADTRIELLQIVYGLSIQFDHYPTCEALLAAMRAGARYDLYLVDFYMEEAGGILLGSDCTTEILKIHPTAIIVGQSGDPREDQFLSHGARGFVKKADTEAMASLIRQLLGLP